MAIEKEQETSERSLPTLVPSAGKFAVVQDDQVVEILDTYEDALKLAYHKFGLRPFLVKKIELPEKTASFADVADRIRNTDGNGWNDIADPDGAVTDMRD